MGSDCVSIPSDASSPYQAKGTEREFTRADGWKKAASRQRLSRGAVLASRRVGTACAANERQRNSDYYYAYHRCNGSPNQSSTAWHPGDQSVCDLAANEDHGEPEREDPYEGLSSLSAICHSRSPRTLY
jgi:hypothetical protein